MRASSARVFGIVSITQSDKSSASADVDEIDICDFFSFESARRTGRFSPPARPTTPSPADIWSGELWRDVEREPDLGCSLPLWPLARSTKARIIVMSSVRTSYCNHNRYDSATTARQPSSGSSNFVMMSATDWFVRNSHTPSDASTRNWSPSASSLRSNSGSEYTPMLSATESPIERVNAQPGKLFPGAHTRGGSPPLSSSSPRLTPQFSWYGTTPSS